MNVPENPRDTFENIIWEVSTYIFYIGGIYIIEVVFKPGFGNQGMPIIATWILNLLEITLLFNILKNFTIAVDGFINAISSSWTVGVIVKRLNSNPERTLDTQISQTDTPISENQIDERLPENKEG